MQRGNILMLGDINIDTVWPVPEFPIPGRDGLVDDVKVEIGGAVVNSAILLNNLGQPTSLLGCVGSDVWAERINRKLAGTQIDLSCLHVDPQATTGLTFIIVTKDGERTMFSHRGANIELRAQDIDEETFKKVSILHISGYSLLEEPQRSAVWRAVELAKNSNIPISLDTGLEPAIKNPKDLRKLLGMLSICISGPEEITELLGSSSTEEAADLLLSAGVQLAAIKLGKNGSLVSNGKEKFMCPSFPVDAVDTTGAGDSYSAGLLYGWENNLSLAACTVLANALGALAASVYGAGFSLPDRQKVVDFLISQQGQPEGKKEDAISEVINNLKKI
jgi:ribokinase